MPANPAQTVLYVIACGGRPAGDLANLVRVAQDDGWDVCVVATPSGMRFLDSAALAATSGHPVRCGYKRPEEPDVLPPADAFLVAPATFNTINKLAAGISDTLALGLLNEAIGMQTPIIAAPFPNQMLARHPAFEASIGTLKSWGVQLIFDPERYALPVPNQGESGNALFPWPAIYEALRHLRQEIQADPHSDTASQ